jgi:hypothetical protein
MAPNDVNNCDNTGSCDNCECEDTNTVASPVTSVVPTVNLGGQEVIVPGASHPLYIPKFHDTPVAPSKVVSPEQQEQYLNKWNKPETRSLEEDSVFVKFAGKITAKLKELFS